VTIHIAELSGHLAGSGRRFGPGGDGPDPAAADPPHDQSGDAQQQRAEADDGPDGPAVAKANPVAATVAVHSGARVAGAIDIPSNLTLQDAAAQLEQAGYVTEISTVFDPGDYLRATDADGQTLVIVGPGTGLAGVPQVTMCD
jgi:hypothetical protein